MEKVWQMQQQILRWERLPALLMALSLLVLGGIILLTSLNLRGRIREQIVSLDGEILLAVSRMQQSEDEANGEAIGSLDDPAEQFSHVLKISRLPGVLGIRLYRQDGGFVSAFPENITEAQLAAGDLARLAALKPVGHYDPRAPLESVDLLAGVDEAAKPVPLLEVNVPLQAKDQTRLLGVAQFILLGDSIAEKFASLDRNIAGRAASEFFAGGLILVLVQWLGIRKVQRVLGRLAAQTELLLHANQELTLAAKTSAVGAVTSHLIHGLKNPLSGLQGFVKGHVAGRNSESDADWSDALATTQRMQSLIGGVVRILEEQQAVGNYEISLRELVEIISARMLPVARSAGIHFYARTTAEGMLGNRDANLVILILENLIQNAFQATPEGKSVRLTLSHAECKILCQVQDEGPGLPEELKPYLFTPCRSSKAGGSGIGLAISRQLALNIGAGLELQSSTPAGCAFCLALPQKLALPAEVSTELFPDRP